MLSFLRHTRDAQDYALNVAQVQCYPRLYPGQS